MTALLAASLISLLIWVHMLFGRAFFWLARERDDVGEPPPPAAWPSVCVVVPARDEADVIERSVTSLLLQDYPGTFRVVLVDDESADGTLAIALSAARRLGLEDRLVAMTGAPRPAGWTGKLWAVAQGVERAGALETGPEYLLLADADIAHSADNLRRLVARATAGGLVLTSLMAKLHCRTPAERMLIPAFVFFFDMLYPFAKVNDPTQRVAAAAGGCMLIQSRALNAQGGVASIRSAIIDDCAMGALMKREGPIWLGLTNRAQSLRPYVRFGEIAQMVSRSAYAQLRYSPLLLILTLIGLTATYLAPPLITLFGTGPARAAAAAAWIMMAISFQPMLRFYRRSAFWGVALPLIGALYAGFTIQSAVDVWMGRGGFWKGRAQAQVARA